MPPAMRSFEPDDLFYRQIPQDFINVRKGRISAAAFQNTTGTLEMSVDWAYLCTPDAVMKRRPDRAVSQFRKQLCDELGQECHHDPVPENEAHCSIVGDKPEPVRAAFARAARVILWPAGFVVPDSLRASDAGSP